MVDYIAATVAAMAILEAARVEVVKEQGIGPVSSVLWAAAQHLNQDARKVLTGGAPAADDTIVCPSCGDKFLHWQLADHRANVCGGAR